MAAMPSRAQLADVRDEDRYLRATWHPDLGVVVVSHWVGQVCVASTPVAVAELSKLIGVLVTALEDAAATSDRGSSPAPLIALRPTLAEPTDLDRSPPRGGATPP